MKLIKLLLMIASLFSVSAQAQVLDVSYKDDARTRTLILPAINPKAVVLPFSGGSGILRLQNDGTTNSPHTFVRSKELWSGNPPINHRSQK